jgi:two-component system response regulator NreC
MTISVFLADDHAIVREGLELILNAQADIEVVGQAKDGQSAISAGP